MNHFNEADILRDKSGKFADKPDAEQGKDGQLPPAAGLYVGSQTPYGQAIDVTPLAPGITRVTTMHGGGTHLSADRNDAIHSALRSSSGWYDEDAESHIVGMYHPDAYQGWMGGDADQVRDASAAQVANWYPSEYEEATGHTIPFGQSHEKDRADWHAKNPDEWVATFTTPCASSPDILAVTLKRGDEERIVAVPEAQMRLQSNTTQHGAFTPPFHTTDPRAFDTIDVLTGEDRANLAFAEARYLDNVAVLAEARADREAADQARADAEDAWDHYRCVSASDAS